MAKNSSKGQRNTMLEKVLMKRQLPKSMQFNFDEPRKGRKSE